MFSISVAFVFGMEQLVLPVIVSYARSEPLYL